MTVSDARVVVAQASHVLFGLGVADAFGHVSQRHPERPDRFLMSRSMAPGMVTPDDVVEHDLDGEPVSSPDTRVFLERFIHAEIYRARDDVVAVAHSHAAAVVPFTVVDRAIRPVSHMCGFLHGTGPAFELADHAGDSSDLLIRSAALGRALAEHLGDANIVLMRGHGFTTVGADIAQAVFRAAYTVFNCEVQKTALQLGQPRYLSPGEAAACYAATIGQTDRAWNLWISQYASRIS